MADGTNESANTWTTNLTTSLTLFRGEAPCMRCDGSRLVDGVACYNCGGTGKANMYGPHDTLSTQADEASRAVEAAMSTVADLVARGQVAIERIETGKQSPDSVDTATRPALAHLANLAPMLATLLSAINAIVLANEDVDMDDPRTKARNAADVVEARRQGRALHIDRFISLDHIVAAAREVVPHVITFSAEAYAAYYDATDVLSLDAQRAFSAALHEACGFVTIFEMNELLDGAICAVAGDAE